MNHVTTTLRNLAAFVFSPVTYAYQHLIWWPFVRLYRLGPSWQRFGFWRNASDASICEQLTGVPIDFWNSHRDDCALRIEQEFSINMVLIETLIYFYVLWSAYRYATPLLKNLVSANRLVPKDET